MNSTTASYKPSHEGNTCAESPKEVQGVPILTLNDGHTIPMLGYGTGTAQARVGSTGDDLDESLVATILMAIRAGYHHLDGAEYYGNERELGEAIKQSGLPRSTFFVTTKIPGTEPTDTEAHFAASLERLGLDYVDLYLIHAPFFASSDADLQAKWAEFEAIQASGRARSIGVSNFLQPQLEAILKTAKVVPAVNQIEYHPYLQHKGLVEFNQEHGIATVAFSPLAALLHARPGPMDRYYSNLAAKYGVTEAEVALRWVVDQGMVVLTTSSKEDRLKGYLANIGRWKLTPREVDNIKEIGREKHYRGYWKNKFAADDRS
ncbi:hypothetical protein V500_01363 [Pseudogymnoascus sp. VKM F-4518 (FW-2643)]|nr:hypothetical protein V500_01363 [Pseudogymnoascus sp. VKM F-4518 (FW-2643)]